MAIDTVLKTILTQPEPLAELSDSQWDVLIHSAQRMGVLGRVQYRLAEGGFLNGVPAQPKMHLESARIVTDNERRIMGWEINRIARALRELRFPIVLLKGAAYFITGMPVANGRISSDIDLLVRKKDLGAVESALLAQGWEHTKLDDYDQFYYRIWSHELPPLRHRQRGTVVDIHHTILPPTGRLHPDPQKLMAAAVAVAGSPFRVLCPPDMVLHSAAHAFQDGDLKRGLKDIVDIDDLLRYFGVNHNFWDELMERSEELDLVRPLYYALRYSNRVLNTPIPPSIMERSRNFAPPWPVRQLMDDLIAKVLSPRFHGWPGMMYNIAASTLYVRSHWLRMPPLLLARHLVHQWLKR
jgi:hypothetical protein